MEETNIFAKRLRQIRTEKNLTQRQLAEAVGSAVMSISAYETGAKNPSLEIVKNIALYFHVSIDWLCGLSDNKSVDNLPQTLGDVLRMLFAIQKSTYLDIYHHTENVDVSPDPACNYYEELYLHEIGFINSRLNTYIQEWYKMLSLYLEGTIDEEVYSLWMEKTLRKADQYSSFGQSLIDTSTTE